MIPAPLLVAAPYSLDRLGEPALTFAVEGRPAPQGSKSGFARNGRVSMVESSKYVKPWRKAVAAAARAAVGDSFAPLQGPLVADMVFSIQPPRRIPAGRGPLPVTIPDLSKLLRATEDALDTDERIIENDSCIVGFRRLEKVYAGDGGDPDALPTPGAVIRLWQSPRHVGESSGPPSGGART